MGSVGENHVFSSLLSIAPALMVQRAVAIEVGLLLSSQFVFL